MKTKELLLIVVVLALFGNADAQIFKKLGKTVGDILGPESSGTDRGSDGVDYNTAKNINTENKRAFYTHDVTVHTVDEKNETADWFFDADELAVRGTSSTLENNQPIFIDSEGYQYGYNDGSERWEKTGMMRTDAMSFAAPLMSVSMLKLPPDPMLDASADFKDKGMILNTFMIIEWAFIYEPDDFRIDGYTEMQESCGSGSTCPTFYYDDPEYKGSYAQFNSEGRLSRIILHTSSQYVQGAGTFQFDYNTPVSVSIPSATEVKMPFQDVLFKGLNVNDK